MRKIYRVVFIIALSLLWIPVMAGKTKQLEWKDLIPAHLSSEDPLAELTQEKRDLAIWVINMLEQLPKRGPETEELYQEIDTAMPSLKEAGIDIKKIMKSRKERQTALVKELHGQKVRMPGYLLPLEFSGAKVTEFLLVPFVGACIHVPPPPPNQIVYVKTASPKGYQPEGLYAPVWVSGEMSAKPMTRDLHLVDGTANVAVGYAISAKHIEPYKQ